MMEAENRCKESGSKWIVGIPVGVYIAYLRILGKKHLASDEFEDLSNLMEEVNLHLDAKWGGISDG